MLRMRHNAALFSQTVRREEKTQFSYARSVNPCLAAASLVYQRTSLANGPSSIGRRRHRRSGQALRKVWGLHACHGSRHGSLTPLTEVFWRRQGRHYQILQGGKLSARRIRGAAPTRAQNLGRKSEKSSVDDGMLFASRNGREAHFQKFEKQYR